MDCEDVSQVDIRLLTYPEKRAEISCVHSSALGSPSRCGGVESASRSCNTIKSKSLLPKIWVARQ